MKGKSKTYLFCNCVKLKSFLATEKKNHDYFDVTMTLQAYHLQKVVSLNKGENIWFIIKLLIIYLIYLFIQ